MRTVGAVVTMVALLATACSRKEDEAAASHPSATDRPATASSAPSSDAATTTTAAQAASLRFTPTPGSQSVNPTTPITVSTLAGTLTSVQLVNPDGRTVSGTMAPDRLSWSASEVLGYGKTYTMTATAAGGDGKSVSRSGKFTTVSPDNMTMPYITTTGNEPMRNGATYGVGIVPVVHFDEEITDRASAEKALVVTTSPHVTGSWNWTDDQTAHWRPQSFYQPGTKVTVAANVYGVQVGPGLYGEADASVSFTIGAKHLSIADDRTHTVSVYFNNKLQRVMPTSMGRGGSVDVNGQTISFWTQNGTYTVIGQGNPVIMDSVQAKRVYDLRLEPRRSQQRIDEFLVGVRRGVVYETVHFLGQWRQPDQIETYATDKRVRLHAGDDASPSSPVEYVVRSTGDGERRHAD